MPSKRIRRTARPAGGHPSRSTPIQPPPDFPGDSECDVFGSSWPSAWTGLRMGEHLHKPRPLRGGEKLNPPRFFHSTWAESNPPPVENGSPRFVPTASQHSPGTHRQTGGEKERSCTGAREVSSKQPLQSRISGYLFVSACCVW